MVAIGAKTFGVVLGVRMFALSYLLHVFARLAFTFNFLGLLGHLKFWFGFRLVQKSVKSPLELSIIIALVSVQLSLHLS